MRLEIASIILHPRALERGISQDPEHLGAAEEVVPQTTPPADVGRAPAFLDGSLDSGRFAGLEHLENDPRRSRADLVRKGRIGEPKFFNSSFSMTVKPGNIRTQKELGGGSLYDIGVYCINAARYLFGAEPKEVVALNVNSGPRKLKEIEESAGALLCFEGERVAAFITSFNAGDVASYRIVGTKGQIHVDPAYEYAEGLGYELTVGKKKTRKRIGKRDQVTAERRRHRSTGSSRSSNRSARRPAASTVTAWPASSRKARPSWKRTSTTRPWTPA